MCSTVDGFEICFAARNATSLNTIENIHFIVIYDELESNLEQINVTRCKFIIMQINTRAQRMFMSLQRIFILVN
jgi:hypothetical protein